MGVCGGCKVEGVHSEEAVSKGLGQAGPVSVGGEAGDGTGMVSPGGPGDGGGGGERGLVVGKVLDVNLAFSSFRVCCCFISAGVTGALPPAADAGGNAFATADRSTLEIALDR